MNLKAMHLFSFGAALFAWSAPASALDSDPSDQNPPGIDSAGPSVATGVAATKSVVDFEIGAKGGYLTPPIRGGTTPFGAGLGGRVGLNVGPLYVGAGVVRFLGGLDIDVSNYALLYGAELGWNIRLSKIGSGTLILRPLVGAGGASIYRVEPSSSASSATPVTRTRRQSLPVDVVTQASGSSSSATSSSTSRASATNTTIVNNVYVDPGMTLMYAAGVAFLGVTGHTLLVPGIRYGASDASTWLSYGVEGQLGMRF